MKKVKMTGTSKRSISKTAVNRTRRKGVIKNPSVKTSHSIQSVSSKILESPKRLTGSQDLRISGLRLSEDNIRRWISELKYWRTNS
ncbi:hypothetical protein AgCh_031862 [Apium graveolens]